MNSLRRHSVHYIDSIIESLGCGIGISAIKIWWKCHTFTFWNNILINLNLQKEDTKEGTVHKWRNTLIGEERVDLSVQAEVFFANFGHFYVTNGDRGCSTLRKIAWCHL